MQNHRPSVLEEDPKMAKAKCLIIWIRKQKHRVVKDWPRAIHQGRTGEGASVAQGSAIPWWDTGQVPASDTGQVIVATSQANKDFWAKKQFSGPPWATTWAGGCIDTWQAALGWGP